MKCWYCGSSITGNKNKMFCNEHCRYKYNHQADMVLTLKKQWFDMIVSGEKAEEYDIDTVLLIKESDSPADILKAAEKIRSTGESVCVVKAVPTDLRYRRVLLAEGV